VSAFVTTRLVMRRSWALHGPCSREAAPVLFEQAHGHLQLTDGTAERARDVAGAQ
jgi:hypothetical protein